MNLDDVYRVKLPRKKKKRIGRGPGSGSGKTAGKGHKGASGRAGAGGKPFYEGGQMPLARRVPMKGFSNAKFKKVYAVVNVGRLNLFSDGEVVDREAMEANGLINAQDGDIKILGNGDLEKKLVVVANAFSGAARKKIEAKGGEAKLAPTKKG